MVFSIQKLSPAKIKIEIEQLWEEFVKFYDKAILDSGKDLEIAGFRKGQAPKEIIERNLDPSKVLVEAAQNCIQDLWPKIILEKNIEAISEPKIEILKLAKGNPLAFSAEVEILPEIKLPDYKTIAKDIEKKEIKVEEKEINDTLNWLYRSRKDSQKFSEINDQWAQSFGGFKNLGELKASIYQGIMVEKEIAEKQRQREEVLEKIAQSMETEPPSILIEREKRQLIDNLKKQIARQLKISFQEYLSRVKKTEKDIEDDFQKIAQKRVKNFLILREIAKQEKISVSEEEKEVRMNEILKQEPGKSEEKKVDIEKLKLYIEDEIKQEKTFQLLNL